MAIKTFKNPAFAGYIVDDGRTSNQLLFSRFKEGQLFISDAISNKALYSANIKDIFFEIKRAIQPDEITEKDKSVIGRAVVGGLLLGPVGAIVGGMSGIGTKQKVKKGNVDLYLYIKTSDREFLLKPAIGHESTAYLLFEQYRKLKG